MYNSTGKGLNFAELGLTKPEERLKKLTEFGNMVEVDPNIPIKRWETLEKNIFLLQSLDFSFSFFLLRANHQIFS